MILDVEGVSGLAERLVVMIFAGADDRLCADISMETVKDTPASRTNAWVRDEGAPRSFVFEDVDEAEMTLVVFTEDASGAPIQFACRRVVYADLESPVQTIELSRVE